MVKNIKQARKANFINGSSSKALNIAKQNLSGIKRTFSTQISGCRFKNENFDFVFSLGVLHHMDNILDQLKKLIKF